MNRRLIAEFILLYLVQPILLWLFRHELRPFLLPGMLALAAGSLFLLYQDQNFHRTRLWNFEGLRKSWRSILLIFLIAAAIPAGYTLLIEPELFLGFARAKPVIWLCVLVLYPVLSAYPQELFFRTLFFERYRPLFPNESAMLAANVALFSLFHVFLVNWIAIVFSAIGGYLFARTYQRSHSTLAAALEHGLWGNFLFTLGLGWYFYAGSIGWR